MAYALIDPPGVVGYTLGPSRYLNVTNRCTLRCAFCPKFNGSWEVGGHDLRLRREPTAAELVAAAGDPRSYRELVFCGFGECTLRLYVVLEAAAELKRLGARRVRVNTDGLANLVHQRDVTPDFEGNIDAVSISINAQSEAVYQRHCRPPVPGAWQAVQRFAAAVTEFVPEVTLTAIDGLEGVDIHACARLAERMGLGFRARTLDVVGLPV